MNLSHDQAVLRHLALDEFLGAMVATPDVVEVSRRPPVLIAQHAALPWVSIDIPCDPSVLFDAHPKLLGTPSDRETEWSAISVRLYEMLMLEWQPGAEVRFDPTGPGFLVSPARPRGGAPWFVNDSTNERPQRELPRDAVVYTLDGRRMDSWRSFFVVIGEAVNGRGGYFGGGLDSLSDCLAGGFGTPDALFAFDWMHSAVSRPVLGYEEAVRMLKRESD